MDRSKPFDGFEFDDDSGFNQKIDAIPAFEFHVLINERHGLLAFHLQIPQFQLSRQTFFIRGFQQTGSEQTMDV
jgi:hypothetical protein